ncbi:hypothetical protein SAMD00024442_12_20 [Candidatus Symbiothrix dinenymphae]|nr:hypothetical protein SAMD00024442_12_20 [Candidatus Symbiothrix dinenymphae]
MNRFFTSIAIALFVCNTAVVQAYSGGSGRAGDPYRISSRADMEALAATVNSGTGYAGTYFLLTRDLTGEEDTIRTVIGNFANPFQGTFDGGGYEVAVNIDASYTSATSDMYVGVFGFARGAIIKNLGVSGRVQASLEATYNLSSGGICGRAERDSIFNCYNKSSVFSESDGSSCVGGICGLAENGTYILDCYNTDSIFSSSSVEGNKIYRSFSGGICGLMLDDGLISNCYNTGNIVSSSEIYFGLSTEPGFESYAGGICGRTDAGISLCFAANETVTATGVKKTAHRIGYTEVSGIVQGSYALSSILVNGSSKSCAECEDSNEGADKSITFFKASSTYQNKISPVGKLFSWDFEHVWRLSEAGSINDGFPEFKKTIVRAASNDSSMGTVTPNFERFIPNAGYTYPISVYFDTIPATNHHFDKWTFEGSDSTITEFTMPAADTVLKIVAHFAVDSFNVRVGLAASGMGTVFPRTRKFGYGGPYTISDYFDTIPLPGYHFLKWTLVLEDSEDEIEIDNTALMVTGDTELKIYFEGNPYNIIFHSNDGSGTDSVRIKTHGIALQLPPSNIFSSPTGYHLDHWNTNADGSGTHYEADKPDFVIDSHSELYAIWEINTYYISASAGYGGSISPESDIVQYGNESLLFTFTANEDSLIENLFIDNVNTSINYISTDSVTGSYTFRNLQSSNNTTHYIRVTFKAIPPPPPPPTPELPLHSSDTVPFDIIVSMKYNNLLIVNGDLGYDFVSCEWFKRVKGTTETDSLFSTEFVYSAGPNHFTDTLDTSFEYKVVLITAEEDTVCTPFTSISLRPTTAASAPPLHVYPNPVSGGNTITIEGIPEEVKSLKIYDFNGRGVDTHPIQTQIPMPSIKGIYFVRVGKETLKVVVE